MKDTIRLTNKTAIDLHRSAQTVRRVYFGAGICFSLLLCAWGVYTGLRWLPAVPVSIAAAALLDVALAVLSRSRYLSLLGQAICTEAAAREIRAGRSESLRREQAINDLLRVKADVQMRTGRQQAVSEACAQDQGGAEQAEKPEGAPVRRRRQGGLQLLKHDPTP